MSVRAMEKLSADPKVNAAPFRIHLNRETKPVTATSSNTHGKKSIKLMERLKKTDQKNPTERNLINITVRIFPRIPPPINPFCRTTPAWQKNLMVIPYSNHLP